MCDDGVKTECNHGIRKVTRRQSNAEKKTKRNMFDTKLLYRRAGQIKVNPIE